MNIIASKGRFATVLALPFLLIAAATATTPDASEPHPSAARHLRLERSAPAADSTVASPAEIRLWFSESTQGGEATSIRLVNSAGEQVETGAMGASEDLTVHHLPVTGQLAAGSYSVVWRTMAGDGHVVRGDFTFQVRSAEER